MTSEPTIEIDHGNTRHRRNRIWRPKVWHKLLLITLTLVIPVAVLVVLLIQVNNEQIDFAQKELVGVSYLSKLRKLYDDVLQYSLLVGDESGSDPAARAKARQTAAARVEKAEAAVDVEQIQSGDQLRTREKWPELKKTVQDVLAGKDASLLASAGLANTTGQFSDLFADVGETSLLLFDPALESYYLMDTMYYRLPVGLATLAEIRGFAAGLARKGAASAADREKVMLLVGSLKPIRDTIDGNLKALTRTNPKVGAVLQESTAEYLKLSDAFTGLVRKKFSLESAAPAGADAAQIVDAGNKAVASGYRVFDESEPNLKDFLEGRVSKYRFKTHLALLSIFVGTVVSLGVVFAIASGVTRQVNSINTLLSQVNKGNVNARAEVISWDELGDMTTTLNQNIVPLIQSRGERDAIQRSITKLLDEVSGVAEGDLRNEVEVSADITGTIADSFNYMIDQLRKIIGNVQDATGQVNTSANDIHASVDELVRGTQLQAQQIVQTSSDLDHMSRAIQQVSANATVSATVARQALASAKQGTSSVQNTILGMSRIRDQVQETAKRIKRLGESTQEVGQIIQLIDDLADRTSILALNASIQAAEAGDAGRGFAVVAEEVERLAVRSTDATKKITDLIKTIQTDTGEAVVAMERGILEVVEGSKLANQAGGALTEIESVSTRLAELIATISQASTQQADGSASLAKSMGQISQITQKTAAGTKHVAESINELAMLADGLRDSVSQFQLPQRSAQSGIIAALQRKRAANGETSPSLLAGVKSSPGRPAAQRVTS